MSIGKIFWKISWHLWQLLVSSTFIKKQFITLIILNLCISLNQFPTQQMVIKHGNNIELFKLSLFKNQNIENLYSIYVQYII